MKYTITNVQPSIDHTTGRQYVDQYGNRSFNLYLEDEKGQTTSVLKRVRKGNPDPKVGDILEGTIETRTSQNGNTYFAFVPEKKEYGKSFSDPSSFAVSYAKDIIIAIINNQKDAEKITTENIKNDLDLLSAHIFSLMDSLKSGENRKEETKLNQSGADEIDISEIPF
jgi:hypothetical protein